MIYLRDATIEDGDLPYERANDTGTRRASFHSDIISYEEHSRWYEAVLVNNNELQYILMNGDVPVG